MVFSRAELVRGAKAAGFTDVSERLVTDWGSLGLLDRGTRSGRGKGKGSGAFYVWPEPQKDLFLTLLGKRREVKNVPSLCVVPVGIWIYWGDEWIPVRQVRLALHTWWSGAGDVGHKERSQRSARTITNAFIPGQAPRALKSELRAALASAIQAGHFSVGEIRPLLQQVLDTREGSWGPFTATPGEVLNGMRAMTVAISRYDELTDGLFAEVRARHRMMILGYVRRYPAFARDSKFGSWFEDPNFELLLNRSCHDLLLQLGLRLIATDEGVQLPPVPIIPWKRPPQELLRLPNDAVPLYPK